MFSILKKEPLAMEWTVFVHTLRWCPLIAKEIIKAKGEIIKVYPDFGIILAKFEPKLYKHINGLPGVRSVDKYS